MKNHIINSISLLKGILYMKKFIKTLAFAGGALVLAKGLDNRIEIVDYDIKNKKIPKSFDGYKIVQISDYHCETMPGLASEIELLNPDIIVSTGDLADDEGSYLPAVRLCKKLINIAPVYAVTGNHDLWRSDYGKFEKELDALGVKVLHDERTTLTRNEDRISLAGIEDPFSVNKSTLDARLRKSIASLPPESGFDILLFHRANMLDYFKNESFDLILAGHMHGGQIRIPHGRGVVAPKSSWLDSTHPFFPKYVGGRYKINDTDVVVNRGLGNPVAVPRLFNRPEITVITLKCDE